MINPNLTISLNISLFLLQARVTYICLDCGFIYILPKPFDEKVSLNPLLLSQPSLDLLSEFSGYVFRWFLQPDPQCIAPKKRFVRYDMNTGKAIGGGLPHIGVSVGLLAGLGAFGSSACIRSSVTFYRTCINHLSNKSLIKFCDC